MVHSEILCRKRSKKQHELLYGISISAPVFQVVHMLVYFSGVFFGWVNYDLDKGTIVHQNIGDKL